MMRWLGVLVLMWGGARPARAADGDGGPTIDLGLGWAMVRTGLRAAEQRFELDGARPGGAPLDVDVDSESRPFGSALTLDLAARPWRGLQVQGRAQPLFNSFLPNHHKNGRVYGAHLALGGGWDLDLGGLTVTPRAEMGLRIGGYGITSFGRAGQPAVVIDGQAFVDDDIGVHVIDVGWLAGGALAVRVPVGGRVAVVADLGAHGLLAQSSVLNIAGAVDESGNTAWVRREHGAPDTRWTVDGRRVQGPGELPYRFSGASASVAVVVRMP